MNSSNIQDHVYDWALQQNFSAPYGVLKGQHVNQRGKRYLSVTFGYARTLDASVEIYNRNFMILRSSRAGNQVYKNFQELMTALTTLA